MRPLVSIKPTRSHLGGGVAALVSSALMGALGLHAGPAAAQSVDTSLFVTNGVVNTLARDGNTLYLGGQFTMVGPAVGGGVPLSAVTGEPVRPYPKVDGAVNAVAPDGAGGWFIGGAFDAVGGVSRGNLAHILADGSVAAWNPNAQHPYMSSPVAALAVVGNTVYVGGDFTTVGDSARHNIAAVDAVTGIPTAWHPIISDQGNQAPLVMALAVSGNTVYLGGGFSSIGGQFRGHVAALDATTGSPTSWAPTLSNGQNELEFPSHVSLLAVNGSTVFACGDFDHINGKSGGGFVALDATTGNPIWLGTGSSRTIAALEDVSNTLYIGGSFTLAGGQSRGCLAALDPATGLATAWNPGAGGGSPLTGVTALTVDGNTVYAAGRAHLAALDATTGAVTSWAQTGDAIRALAVGGGVVYAGGFNLCIGGQTRNDVAALDTHTGMLTPWDPNANDAVNALAVRGSTVYVGGVFTGIGGQARNRIAALDASTGAATGWDPGASATVSGVNAIAVGDGAIYVGGQFSIIGGGYRSNVAALDPLTGGVTAWNPIANGLVLALVTSGSTVYAGGGFTQIGGLPRSYLAALDAGPGMATAWNPNPDGSVAALAIAGGTVYVGGSFAHVGGQPRSNIAALSTATGSATMWNPNADANVLALALMDGLVYAGGVFLHIGGQTRGGIAALDMTLGTATGWNPNSGRASVYTLAADTGTVYVGGSFGGIAGEPRPNLAAFRTLGSPTAALVSFVAARGVTDHVEIRWEVSDRSAGIMAVERSETAGAWHVLGTASPDGTGLVQYTDRDVVPGARYGYRLAFQYDGRAMVAGETWVDVPFTLTLALYGARPNPAAGPLTASFSLPTGAPATLELLDVTGRRLTLRDVGGLGPGHHELDLSPRHPLAAGVYWLRLKQGPKTLTAKAMVLR